MTPLLRSRVVACLPALALSLGSLTGIAQAAPLTVSVADADGKPLAQAVVYVMVHGTKALAEAGTTGQIGQRERQFTPQVNVIQTGTAVSFPNFDTVRHHVYSFSPIQKFELKLYAGTPAAPVVFDKPGTAVLGCNIHDRMNAWVHVVDTPLFTKTDATGKALLEVPAGDHKLRTWHPLLPEPALPVEQALHMNAAATQAAVKLPVHATASGTP
ncbi:MAG: hypothetical protein AD742_07120 [Methylibium sp. NZG]|nr:MAG: hypothetical protein AD742_07120 [Methylibium sp. NZG]